MRALTAYVENAGLAYVFAVKCSFFVGRASAGMNETKRVEARDTLSEMNNCSCLVFYMIRGGVSVLRNERS